MCVLLLHWSPLCVSNGPGGPPTAILVFPQFSVSLEFRRDHTVVIRYPWLPDADVVYVSVVCDYNLSPP